ncbi:MAG: saccharopine dehydrogenase NADP-binding domain-containing protein [Bacteroidota bacterium]
MEAASIILYGSYGYTGKLIAELAAEKGVPLILSGRNPEKVKAIAAATGHPHAAVSLDNATELDALLSRGKVVLHAAGPFVDTYRAMTAACLRTQTHYLDITGEIEVFEGVAQLDRRAQEKGIMLLPGAGFDVVPTDCMAALLKARLPDAQELELAFKSGGGVSRGTATTMVRSMGEPNLIRRQGRITPVRPGKREITIDYGKGPRTAFGIPWGDVSTAYYTTEIPNIATYTVLPPPLGKRLRMSGWMAPLLRTGWFRRRAQKRIDSRPPGPSAETRRKGRSLIWGRVRNASGQEEVHHFTCPEGYSLTAAAALHLAQRAANGDCKVGFQTPAGCYGAGLLDAVVAEMAPE